jgi:hypothetical protein
MRVNVRASALMGVLIAELAGGSEAAYQDHLHRELARPVPSPAFALLSASRFFPKRIAVPEVVLKDMGGLILRRENERS